VPQTFENIAFYWRFMTYARNKSVVNLAACNSWRFTKYATTTDILTIHNRKFLNYMLIVIGWNRLKSRGKHFLVFEKKLQAMKRICDIVNCLQGLRETAQKPHVGKLFACCVCEFRAAFWICCSRTRCEMLKEEEAFSSNWLALFYVSFKLRTFANRFCRETTFTPFHCCLLSAPLP